MTHSLIISRSASLSSSADRLRLVLRANATTSALGGLVMVAAPHALDALLGTGHPGWIRMIGMALLPFAALVVWLSTRGEDQLRRLVPAVVLGDIGWVAASIVTVLLGWYSTTGNVIVLVMAAAVDGFAVMQWRLSRRLSS